MPAPVAAPSAAAAAPARHALAVAAGENLWQIRALQRPKGVAGAAVCPEHARFEERLHSPLAWRW